MPFFVAFLDALLILIAMAAGFVTAVLYFFPVVHDSFLSWMELILTSPLYNWILPVTSLYFFFLVLFSLFFRRIRVSKQQDLYFTSTKGQIVQIANKAVTDFIQKMVESLDEVHSATVTVYSTQPGGQVQIKIEMSIWDGASYPELIQRTQHVLHDKLVNSLGIDQLKGIHWVLRKYIRRQFAPAKPKTEPSQPEVGPALKDTLPPE